jgi:hypothetical protein
MPNTHIRFDHFDPAPLEALLPAGGRTVLVAPKTVAEKIPELLRDKTTVRILTNGQKPARQWLSTTQQEVEWLMGEFSAQTVDKVCKELFGGEGSHWLSVRPGDK